MWVRHVGAHRFRPTQLARRPRTSDHNAAAETRRIAFEAAAAIYAPPCRVPRRFRSYCLVLITPAFAQATGASPLGSTDMLIQFAPFIVIFVIMYFLILRPQQKRAKEQRTMITAAKRGDTIVTSGGLVGKITKATDDSEVEVEIAPNVRVRLVRSGIADVRIKGEPAKEIPAK
jgi:preprotein translocase subunit YajC